MPLTKTVGKGVGKKLGPLPVWAWALVAIGGVVGFVWWRGRSGGVATEGSSATILTTGVSPQQAASGGYPPGVTPSSQMISPEVAAALTDAFGNIGGQITDLQNQSATTYAGVGADINQVETTLEGQSNKLDSLTAQLATLTLAAPKAGPRPTATVAKHKVNPPHKAQRKPAKPKRKPAPVTKSHTAPRATKKKVKPKVRR
jgi:hypothetical protein